MRLTHLKIANCSRVSDIDIDVRDNLVLIGPNGSGKSTVLLCLDMLLGMDEQMIRSELSEGFVREGAHEMVIEAALRCGGAGDGEITVSLFARPNGNGIELHREIKPSSATASFCYAQDNPYGWSLLRPQTGPSDERSDGMRALSNMVRHAQPEAGVSILAIDEPEAHLHPSSQRSLVKMLKSSGGQMVLVTHSPTIAGSFEPDEIVVIRTDGTAAQPREHFLSKNTGTLARWWIGRQLEPLTAGTVIAVEGPSDRLIVTRVASALGIDLDRRDIVVVETNGCGDMKVVESIFGSGGFGIPLFELIDSDASDEAANRLDVEIGDLESRNVFVSIADLKDEYVRAIGVRRLWDKFHSDKVFSKKSMRQVETGLDGYPSASALARYIREKSYRKIPAALAADELIDASNARAMRSVARLLDAVQ